MKGERGLGTSWKCESRCNPPRSEAEAGGWMGGVLRGHPHGEQRQKPASRRPASGDHSPAATSLPAPQGRGHYRSRFTPRREH